MRVLEINDSTREDIAKVVTYAKEHRYNEHMIKLLISGDLESPGDNPDYLVHIHDGYRVIYTIEEHKVGFCHHISISVDRSKKYPHEMAVLEIMKLFGMEGDYKKCLAVWPQKETESVNVLQEVVLKVVLEPKKVVKNV